MYDQPALMEDLDRRPENPEVPGRVEFARARVAVAGRLPNLDADSRQEIVQAFDRLVNKLLHPALESLRHASRHGPPQNLLDALKRLFQLKD